MMKTHNHAKSTKLSIFQDRNTELGIDGVIANNLLSNGVEEYFPVQSNVIPLLMKFNSSICVRKRDICVSAPTGSGKTLAYAVPISSILKRRQVVRLRAIIILPSRELAAQVYTVFCTLLHGTDLKIVACTGQTDFYEEQQMIVGPNIDSIEDCQSLKSFYSPRRFESKVINSSGNCNVDIIVCTPGRLIEHIQQTKGFSLEHLRFLVLDEADRLLGNAYHFWVKSLIESTKGIEVSEFINKTDDYATMNDESSSLGKRIRGADTDKVIDGLGDSNKHQLQRLLFSATLSANPGKLALLGITNPIILKVRTNQDEDRQVVEDTEYSLPPTLKEFSRTCDTKERPLQLIAMLVEAIQSSFSAFSVDEDSSHQDQIGTYPRGVCQDSKDMCIVFTSSVETTHRLARLLQIFNGQHNEGLSVLSSSSVSAIEDESLLPIPMLPFSGRVAEMSRFMNREEREAIIKDAMSGSIKVLVSSDHMARGIDLPNVKLVINYDVPKFSKTYVHRVGRTARANKVGYCVTLLKTGQMGNFKSIRNSIGSSAKATSTSPLEEAVGKCKISKLTIDKVKKSYEISLEKLPHFLDFESQEKSKSICI